VRTAAVIRDLAFECLDFRPEDKTLGFENPVYGTTDFVADRGVLSGQIEQGNRLHEP